MDFIENIYQLQRRYQNQKDKIVTEQACKTALVLPFLQNLDYDIFNPAEIIPEFTSDHGVKKGEKVDYAININDKVDILIECKGIGANLEAKHASQLFRYFSATDAKFAILTDGLKYLFFTDLENENKMDEKPFFTFNIMSFEQKDITELKRFSKRDFNTSEIMSKAINLKYHNEILLELKKEFDNASEELVRLLTVRVDPKRRFTATTKDQFTAITNSAMKDFLKEVVNDKVKPLLDSETSFSTGIKTEINKNGGINTTEEELKAFEIIKAIASEITSVQNVFLRDSKSYCAILFTDNNRKQICRLYFNNSQNLSISIYTSEGEVKHQLKEINELYKFKADLHSAISKFLEKKPEESLPEENLWVPSDNGFR